MLTDTKLRNLKPGPKSIRDMRCSVYEGDLKRPFARQLLHEITHEELRSLCDAIVARGTWRTGHRCTCAGDRDARITVCGPTRARACQPGRQSAPMLDRYLSAARQVIERLRNSRAVRILEKVQSAPTLRLAVKLLVLTIGS